MDEKYFPTAALLNNKTRRNGNFLLARTVTGYNTKFGYLHYIVFEMWQGGRNTDYQGDCFIEDWGHECIACIGWLFGTLYGDRIMVGDRPNKVTVSRGSTACCKTNINISIYTSQW